MGFNSAFKGLNWKYSSGSRNIYTQGLKDKAISLQAWTGPESSGV